MTREQCEKKILEKLKEIEAIHKEYNPNANYLSVGIFSAEGHIHFNNTSWEEDFDYPIECSYDKEGEEND